MGSEVSIATGEPSAEECRTGYIVERCRPTPGRGVRPYIASHAARIPGRAGSIQQFNRPVLKRETS